MGLINQTATISTSEINYKPINVIKIDQNFYNILLKQYFLKVTNAYYI